MAPTRPGKLSGASYFSFDVEGIGWLRRRGMSSAGPDVLVVMFTGQRKDSGAEPAGSAGQEQAAGKFRLATKVTEGGARGGHR